MKTILIILFLFGGTLSAQNKQFKADFVSYRLLMDTIWNDWKMTETRVVFFEGDSVISVFSTINYKEFKVLIKPEKIFTIKDYQIIRFSTVDDDGDFCYIDVFRCKENMYHIYFRWMMLEIVYQVKKI